MMKRAEGKIGCPKLTRIEKLTKGLLERSDEDSTFVIQEGRVFLKASVIRKNSFVIEYAGDIISEAEASARMKIYESSGGGFSILYFTFQEINMAMDSSQTKSFGRFLSHSKNPNIRFYRPFIVDLNSVLPKIAAYALRDIQRGEEITVDYGIQGDDCEDGNATTSSDSQEDFELSSKISIVRSFCTGSSEFSSLSTFNNTGCLSAGRRTIKMSRKIISTGEFAYSFKNLAPEGFKKSFFASYQNLGVPDQIKPMPLCLSKAQLLWFNNICNLLDTTNEVGKLSRVTSASCRNNSSVGLCSGATSFTVLPSKKGISRVPIERMPPEIPSNSCDDADETDRSNLNIQDDQSVAISTDLLPSVNLMGAEGLVATYVSSETDLEKVSPSFHDTNSFPLSNTNGQTPSVACSGIRNWRKRILDEAFAEEFMNARKNSQNLKENNIQKGNYTKISSALQCKVILTEVTNSITQSGKLARNVLNHVSVKHSSSQMSPVTVVNGFVSTEDQPQ